MTVERFKLRPDICAQEEDQLFWNEWGCSGVKTKQRRDQIVVWNIPDPSWVKVNFDGSKESDSMEMGAE